MGGRHKMIEVVCGQCGKVFQARAQRVSQGLGKYCSRACSAEAARIEGLKTHGKEQAKKHFNKTANRWEVHWMGDDGKQHSSTYARWAWEMNFGEIPDGHRVSFVDGNQLNIELSNFKLISPEEFGQAISERLMGHDVSDETRQKISEAHIGKTLSDEHKKEIGQGIKRLWEKEDSPFRTDEYIRKLSGRKAWNYRMRMSDEYRQKLSESQKRRWSDPEEVQRLSEYMKEKYENPEEREKLIQQLKDFYAREDASEILSAAQKEYYENNPSRKEEISRRWTEFFSDPENRRLMSEKLKGREFSNEHRQRLSESGRGKHSGENNHFWRGGRNKIIYPIEFTPYLKRKVRRRDKYTCQTCGANVYGSRGGHVHHIDGNKVNCEMDNLILLCSYCHNKIHWSSDDSNPKWAEFRAKLKYMD